MTDIIVDGKTRVFAVPAAALDISALTVANIGTGEAGHDELIPTGLEGFEASTAEVDNTALSSTFDTRLPGRSHSPAQAWWARSRTPPAHSSPWSRSRTPT